jgi:hypothetical protein
MLGASPDSYKTMSGGVSTPNEYMMGGRTYLVHVIVLQGGDRNREGKDLMAFAS